MPRPYITARFSLLPAIFHPGDQKQYGGFDNRGLEPGHRYVLFVLAVLPNSEPVSASHHGSWLCKTLEAFWKMNVRNGVMRDVEEFTKDKAGA